MESILLPLTAKSAVMTFEESYCGRHGCTPAQFRRRVFWRALHRHALPFAPVLLLTRHFDCDRDLIGACARARSLRELQEKLSEHRYQPQNNGWLRRRLGFRLSIRRLRGLARDYLPGAGLPPPFASPVPR